MTSPFNDPFKIIISANNFKISVFVLTVWNILLQVTSAFVMICSLWNDISICNAAFMWFIEGILQESIRQSGKADSCSVVFVSSLINEFMISGSRYFKKTFFVTTYFSSVKRSLSLLKAISMRSDIFFWEYFVELGKMFLFLYLIWFKNREVVKVHPSQTELSRSDCIQ